MFNFEPAVAREQFAKQGFVHLRNVLQPAFLEHLQSFYRQSLADHSNEQDAWKIYGKKRQYLFDFPSRADAEEFRQGMAALTGIAPDDFTVSERHLKVYDEAAEPWPAPHKDRAASEISIGIPIHIPEGSSACVFPDLKFGPNPEEKAVFLTDRDHPDLENVYRKEECVMLHEQPGDIVAFLGSSIFHERVKPAGAAILYIKVNATGRDPLGENIYAAEPA